MPKTNQSSLLTTTRDMLQRARERGTTYLDIYNVTKLRPNWLSAFANDKIKDPSVRRVQALHDHLLKASA